MKLQIRKIHQFKRMDIDDEYRYNCFICNGKVKYLDILIVENMFQRISSEKQLYISCCSQVCAEMAILQEI